MSSRHATCIRYKQSMDINERQREDCVVTRPLEYWITMDPDPVFHRIQIPDACVKQACHMHPVHRREGKDCVIAAWSRNIGSRWNPAGLSQYRRLVLGYSGIGGSCGILSCSPATGSSCQLQPESFLTFSPSLGV